MPYPCSWYLLTAERLTAAASKWIPLCRSHFRDITERVDNACSTAFLVCASDSCPFNAVSKMWAETASLLSERVSVQSSRKDSSENMSYSWASPRTLTMYFTITRLLVYIAALRAHAFASRVPGLPSWPLLLSHTKTDRWLLSTACATTSIEPVVHGQSA